MESRGSLSPLQDEVKGQNSSTGGVRHFPQNTFPVVQMLPYLDLVHVHDGPGGSLGAQTVADALV